VLQLDTATSAATDWNPNASERIFALAVSQGSVYAGGRFARIGGLLQPNVAATAESKPGSSPPVILPGTLAVAPNPTRAACTIQYVVARSGPVRLDVLDVSGRLMATLANHVQDPGRYTLTWDGTGSGGLVASGLFFVRFTAPGQTTVKRLAVVR